MTIEEELKEIIDYAWKAGYGCNGDPEHEKRMLFNSIMGWRTSLQDGLIDDEIIRMVIKKNGPVSQIIQMHEECQELALAIHKFLHRAKNHNDKLSKRVDVIDEIADVKIMMAQANILFSTEAINERIRFKMNRLRERLNKKPKLKIE